MAIDLNDEIVQDFLVEAGEILERLGEELVQLEDNPGDQELLNAVFRAFHTVKGGAGFIGIEPMVALCHRAEDAFNLVRQGERAVDANLMDVMLRTLDELTAMFAAIGEGETPATPDAELMSRLGALLVDDQEAEPAAQATDVEPVAIAAEAGATQEDSASSAQSADSDTKNDAKNDEITDGEFEALLDSLHGTGKPARVPPAPESAGTQVNDDISENEFEALLDNLHGTGAPGGDAQAAAPAPAAGKAGDDISEGEFEHLLDELHGAGKGPVGKAPEPAGGVSATEKTSATPAPRAPAARPPAAEPTVRVPTGVLDRIMNMVGELVLVRNRISTLESSSDDEEMTKAVSNLDVVTADLQSSVMRTRMQPIKKVFGRFPRVVRDLARSLGKEVDLVMQGEDTDLDKNLVEALADPLIHLVRNAVDHGMETPEVREAAGKPRKGTVTLSAQQEGDRILLVVADDGAGMDADALRRKVVEKGIMDEDAATRLSERECFHLIFAPGFSLKSEISEVSGRGVGMDVVKSRISQLNGQVDIESELGVGTRILIRVPLTLAIVPTLMVVLGEQIFALPLVSVKEIFELQTRKTNVIDGQLSVVLRGKPLPLFYLSRWLAKEHGAAPQGGHVVVVHAGNQIVGFIVDQLIGQEEVVIKPLGAMLQGTNGLSGATVTGDGRIALVLDAPGLLGAYA